MGLQQKVINGMMWSSIGQFVSLGVSFLSNIVLARLLTPDDFGCVGMLTIFLALSYAFINGGFGMALIQKKDATDIDYTTIFYWNLIVSILFVTVLYFSAPVIADFYGLPKLCKLLRVMSLDLIIVALSIVPTNQLKKELKFKQLASRTIVSTIVSTSITIYLAYIGWGVWSIVAHQLMKSGIILIMLWSMTSWRPKFIFSFASLKELFGFGSMMLLSNLLNTLYTNINGLLIGKVFSATQLGYYSQARKLEEVPSMSLSSVINEVSFSAFSSIQEQKEKLLMGVRNNVNSVAFFCFPMFFLLILIAPTLIVLLFGSKWEPSVPMFQILCFGSMLYTLNSIYESAIKAIGKGKVYFATFTLNRAVGLLMILVGMKWGLNSMLIGMAIASYFALAVNMIVDKKILNYSFKDQIGDLFPYYILSIVLVVLVKNLFSLFDMPSIIELLLMAIMYCTTYLAIAFLLKFKGLQTYIQIVKSKFGK